MCGLGLSLMGLIKGSYWDVSATVSECDCDQPRLGRLSEGYDVGQTPNPVDLRIHH